MQFNYIGAISLLLSLVAIVISIIVARSQRAVAHEARLLPFITMLNESNTREFRELLVYVTDNLAKDFPQPRGGGLTLDLETRHKVRPLTSFYNEVGVLVANKVIPIELVSGMMGGAVVNSWRVLAPYIYARRIRRGNDPNYYAYYEHLAACIRELGGPKPLEEKLDLKKLPPDQPSRTGKSQRP